MGRYLLKIRSHNLRCLLCGLMLLANCGNVFGDAYDWLGGTSTDPTVASNWWNSTTRANGVPGSADDVSICVHSSVPTWIVVGVLGGTANITVTRMPIVATNTTWKSLTFGYLGPQSSYTYGVKALQSITVNTNTLTITGNVTQNHNPSAQGSNFNYSNTVIAGTGTLLCQGNFLVGDATVPGNTVADVSQVSSQITQLTITGNLTLQSNGNNQSGGNAGICYPYFSVEKGTTTLVNQMTFATVNSPLADGFDTYNPPLTTYPGYGKFTADNTTASPSTVELKYKTPIVPADKFNVYFTYGGNNGTVLYDDPTSTDNQTIYTANEPSVTTTQTYINTTSPAYYNLTFAGASTKVVDKNSTLGTTTQGLTVGNNWTTGGGAVNLNTNNPTVTVTGNWTNATTITQGSGNIVIGGALTNNSGGVLSLGTGNLSIAGNYTNNVGATYTQSTGTTFFTGSGAQALVDNSTTGTLFKLVTFNGGGTATMSAGTNNVNFSLASTGLLTMSNNSKLVAGTTATAGGAAYLTLNSDGTGSGAVAAMSGTAAITGNVNVQRFLTGGSTYTSGRWVYRGYRLMSSAVNMGLVSGQYPYTINYLAANAIVTGAKSTYGTVGGNPTLYAYSEDYTPDNTSFTGGNFKGITDISTVTSPYTLAITSNGTSKALYVGNGYLFFFRGDNTHSVGTSPGKTTYPFVAPENVTFTATGFLNQGTYVVNNWYNGSNLLYTTVTTPSPGNAAVQGFNLVGNPYPSAIDWEAVNSGGIVTVNVNPSIYVFNYKTGHYSTYSSSTHVGSDPTVFMGKIASGQGFFVQANNTGATLTFKETAKSPSTQLTSAGGTLLMGTPVATKISSQLLRLKLAIDSLNYDETVIGFWANASSKFNPMEDSPYLNGSGAIETLSSFSTDSSPQPLSINFLALPKQTPERIKLNVSATNSGLLTLKRTQLDALPPIYQLWLMDNYKKDSLDIRNNSTYAFNIDRADTNSFGANRFELVIRQNPQLAIHLLDFAAVKATGGVNITWKTENEQDYTNFTVERSTDNGLTYNVLGGFLSNGQQNYSLTDATPLSTDIYRLKIEDLNGTVTYSKSITINYTNASNQVAASNIRVYPNPAVGTINLSIKSDENSRIAVNSVGGINKNLSLQDDASAGSYSIRIINVMGTVVKSVTSSSANWQDNVSNLSPGTYIIQVNDNKNKVLIGKTTFVKL